MTFIPKGQFHAHFWDSSEGDKGLQTLLLSSAANEFFATMICRGPDAGYTMVGT